MASKVIYLQNKSFKLIVFFLKYLKLQEEQPQFTIANIAIHNFEAQINLIFRPININYI